MWGDPWGLPRGRHLDSRDSSAGVAYHHFDGMISAVVDKGNRLVGLWNAIDGHARLAFPGGLLQDIDFVDRLPVLVGGLELPASCLECQELAGWDNGMRTRRERIPLLLVTSAGTFRGGQVAPDCELPSPREATAFEGLP